MTRPSHRIHPGVKSAVDQLNRWRGEDETIVFTNGVFDLIHPGHVLYLEEAAALGSKLVIGLNSDASTRLLNKGEHRPINDQSARATVLAALRVVDMVIIFDEIDPLLLIKTVKPDVLVKGGDYSIDEIVGAKEVMAWGGTVRQLKFVPGFSTTAIEQKIRNAG